MWDVANAVDVLLSRSLFYVCIHICIYIYIICPWRVHDGARITIRDQRDVRLQCGVTGDIRHIVPLSMASITHTGDAQ